MQYLPVGINLRNKRCLVVGGGDVASRKVARLLDAGASVTVVSIEVCDAVQGYVEAGDILLRQRAYVESDLVDARFVVAATNSTEVNTQVAQDAEQLELWCNTAEQIKNNSVIFPSLINRDPVVIAVSSGGVSPVLARVLCAQLEAFIPASIGKLAMLAKEHREQVKKAFGTIELRRRFWNRIITGKVAMFLHADKDREARAEIERLLTQESTSSTTLGEVYLVGAGPGDPDLLTIRALRLIQRSEIVLHDRLVSDEVMALCPSSAEFVYVGKKRASHAMRQNSINQTLVKYAQQGKRVLRLKGGDPFIFGRGGEEIETLAENGIDFQVVPGITAASGCASYAGIPLTHRDYAQSCVFVAGQLKNGTIDLPWKSLAIPGQTIVCYMGLVGLPDICASLVNANLDPDTPAALIEQGTTVNQRVIVGTVTTLPSMVAKESVKAPTLIIIGQVVRLHSILAWRD